MPDQYTSKGFPVDPPATFAPTLRQLILEDWSTFQVCINTYLILNRFLSNKNVYFSPERRWGTWLQIFWLVLYFSDNLNTILRLILDDNPLDRNLKIQNIFMMHSGYVQFLMLIYKTQVIIMTYFRNKRSATFNENIPDGIFTAITFILIMSYIRMGRLFATDDYFDMLDAYLQYNVVNGVLAVIALLISLVLVWMIVRAESNSPFKNIILNRNMFWQFIALQIVASGFYDVLTFYQFSQGVENPLWLWFLATCVVDWPVTFFEWHHHKIFLAAGSGASDTGGNSNPKSGKTATSKLVATDSQNPRSQTRSEGTNA
ncbi:hypothetical protein DFS34DRAFT_593655 [Phlyctochytrium arcticum]|nr:hypothetical protein DFS34DRAFT_593655 [Phlyctochytrium arcticum]